MYKKVIIICMAVAAFAAFAVSASASAASPLLTDAEGIAVPVRTFLRAQNTAVTKFITTGATVECSGAVLTGTLTRNNTIASEPVEGTIETALFFGGEPEGNCVSGVGRTQVTTGFGSGGGSGVPYCASALAGDVLHVRGGACGSAVEPLTFALDVHTGIGVISCQFERTTKTGPITGTYNTKTVLVGKIKPEGSKFVGTSGGICPTAGSLEMSVELQENPGGVLTMD
jgi:hypothetical protein